MTTVDHVSTHRDLSLRVSVVVGSDVRPMLRNIHLEVDFVSCCSFDRINTGAYALNIKSYIK